MAKGNDGNFLQHSVEVAAANRLMAENRHGLHIAFTHGMSPFECFEPKGRGVVHSRLYAALRLACRPPKGGEPLIVTAYRRACASQQHYPNSAELMRALCKDKGVIISGGITEKCSKKHDELSARWEGSQVKTKGTSWRREVGRGGVLACPQDLRMPWLFAMDPMTFSKGEQHDDNLHPSDVDRLSDVLTGYAESGLPGMVALFVYSVHKESQQDYWGFIDEITRRTCMQVCKYSLTHNGGNRI